MRVALRAAVLVVAMAPGGARSDPPTVPPTTAPAGPRVGPYQLRPAPAPSGPVGSAAERGPGLPWSWPALEQVRPDSGQESQEELLGWLVASEDAQRAEALIRLLSSADGLLPRLEALAASTGDEAARARLLEPLRVLSLRRLRLEQLEAYPHLSALVARDVVRGRELVAPWMAVASADALVEELPSSLCGVGPQPVSKLLIEGGRLQRLRDELRALGGLALPAIEQLLSSPSAPARLQGLALADVLDLRPSRTTLARLQQDPAELELAARYAPTFFSPKTENLRSKVSIARRAKILTQEPLFPELRQVTGEQPVALGIEGRLDEWLSAVRRLGEDEVARQRLALSTDLTNVLRGAGAWQARDEQEYWNRARPLWRAWWRAVGPGVEAYDRMHWFNLSNSYKGFQFVSEPRGDNQSVLRIAEPSGMEAEVLYLKGRETSMVRRGTLPLSLGGVPPELSKKVRLRVGDEWMEFVWLSARTEGETTTVWLNPELRRRHLEATKETP